MRIPIAIAALFLLTFQSAAQPLRDRIDRYAADHEALQRSNPIWLSEARRQRLATFYQEQSTALQAVDFEKLDRPSRIDYLLFKNTLAFETSQLEHERKQLAEIAPLLPFAQGIVTLEEARRRMLTIDAESAAKTVAAIATQAATARKDLEAKPATSAPSKVTLARAIDSLRGALRAWHEFYDAYDPLFTWWMKETYPRADKSLDEYASLLRRRVADGQEDPVIGDPIGRAALLDSLAAEMIPYTPEELIALAEKEFTWCEAEMKRAATDLGFNGDWSKALAHVSAMHVKPGEQPALIKRLADESTQFVEERQLVTIPPLCKEIWRMEMMTPQRQKVNPYFTGGEVISVSFPTDSMSFDDKQMSLRGNNPAFCRATVHHELIPGHHLQGFMAQRYNPHRRIFNTPFLVEGWALYWEMRLWDLGFAKSAEDRVGMLFWRAHRCARIIFSLKFHLGQMTASQAIDFLVARVGHEPRNATAEVRRSVNGLYSPLYQAAYMLGGLQLRTLHQEFVQSKKLSEREFHDHILQQNAIPIEMIRQSFRDDELKKDFKPQWRFYDGN